jgi:autotransporter-associated beta strand protein
MVNTAQDAGSGSLRAGIEAVNAGTFPGIEFVQLTSSPTTYAIVLDSPLPPIIQDNVTIFTNRNTVALNGSNLNSGIFLWNTVTNFTINTTTDYLNNPLSSNGTFSSTNTASIGGNGGVLGGGALGAGGGIFVPPGANVTIQGIALMGCQAIGGNGGNGNGSFVGGGGGMSGGNGQTVEAGVLCGGGGGGGFAANGGGGQGVGGAGGGGIGLLNVGGDAQNATTGGGGGGSDINPGQASGLTSGGNGGNGSTGSGGAGGTTGPGAPGTLTGGGGGGSTDFVGGPAGTILGGQPGGAIGASSGGGGGGGVGGGGGAALQSGGKGGFAGGGGGGGEGSSMETTVGGSSIFGGGGGGGNTTGGDGGFGGGGGGFVGFGDPGIAGFGGGDGATAFNGGGGGGAGLGGAIFIGSGATLTVTNNFTISGSNATGGGNGGGTGNPGSALGKDIFITSTGILNFGFTNNPNVLNLSNAIYSDVYTGSGGGSGGIIMSGTGILGLGGANFGLQNFYAGSTTFTSGTIQVTNDNQLGLSNNSLNFNGGTMSIIVGMSTPAFSTSRTTTLSSPGGTISTASTVTATFGGVISGMGALTKIGSGTLVLSNTSNVYSGGTNINAGTVQISNPANLGESTGTVAFSNGAILELLSGYSTATLASPISLTGSGTGSGGTIQADSSVNGTFSGAITGTGIFNIQGTGEVILSNTSNNYSGRTNILSGTLSASATDALSSSSDVHLSNVAGATLNISGFNQAIGGLADGGTTGGNVVLGGNTLTFGGTNTSTTYSGSISGTGGQINKTGTGTTIFGGNNSYTGLTTVTSGTLQVNAFDSISSSSGIADNGTFIFNHTGSGTYSGNIVGTGDLVQQNSAGSLNLTGTNSVDDFSINAGTVYINGGGTTATQTTIASGATLRGVGPLAGPITNFGTVFPGNSIDTMVFLGDYVQESGSALAIEVSPQDGQADLLDITGTMTIQPNATLQLMPLAGTYSVTNVYQIVSTTGGVTGTFSNVPENFPSVQFDVLYMDNGIFLEVIISNLGTIAKGGNQKKVANYIDSLNPPPGSDLANVIDILRTLNASEFNAALDQLQPAPYKDLILGQQENVFRISDGILYHLDDLINTDCRRSVNRKKQLEFWSEAFGDYTRQDGKHGLLGYHSKGGGALVGLDYSFTNHFVLGAAGAYSYSNVHTSQSRAKGHINGYYGILYGLLQGHHLFLDLALIGGFDQFDASRKIKFTSEFMGGVDRRAYTDHDGWNLDGHAGAGVIIDQWDVVEIRPFVCFDYLFLHENGFTEHGAKSLNLHVRHSDSTMLRSEAGINLARCFRIKHGVWIPEVRFSVIRENRFHGNHYRSNFIDEPGSFVVTGLSPDRTLYSPGAGLTGAFYDGRLSMSVYYDGAFGDGYNDQTGIGQLSWMF